jgi:hypothetical protein
MCCRITHPCITIGSFRVGASGQVGRSIRTTGDRVMLLLHNTVIQDTFAPPPTLLFIISHPHQHNSYRTCRHSEKQATIHHIHSSILICNPVHLTSLSCFFTSSLSVMLEFLIGARCLLCNLPTLISISFLFLLSYWAAYAVNLHLLGLYSQIQQWNTWFMKSSLAHIHEDPDI